MKVKIVAQDGVILGVFIDAEAKKANVQLDIIDADSEYDTDESIQRELSDPDLILIDGTFTRHAKALEEKE